MDRMLDGCTPQQFDELVRTEYAKWGKVIKEAKIPLQQ